MNKYNDKFPLGIIIFDKNQKCLFSNEFINKLMGKKNNEIISYTEYEKLMETYDKNKYSILNQSINDTVLVLVRNYNNINPESIDKVITFQDLDYFKSYESEYRNVSDKIIKDQSIFLSNMSHELFTPLTGVKGNIDLMKFTHLNKTQKKHIEDIEDSCFNLITVVNDILDYAKLVNNQVSLKKELVDLDELLETLNSMMIFKIIDKGLQLKFTFKTNISKKFETDRDRLLQILVNLIGNSIKFTKKGLIELEIIGISIDDFLTLLKEKDFTIYNTLRDTDLLNNYNFIRFNIKDTGCGIKLKDQDKLFKSFNQIKQDITKTYPGTGLGLVIARELLKLLNGAIWLEQSIPNEGSIFSFILPVYEIETDYRNYFKNKTILIIDKQFKRRIILSRYLTKNNSDILPFNNIEEALLLKEKIIHLIIIDDDFTDIISNINIFKNIPIIYLSEFNDNFVESNINKICYNKIKLSGILNNVIEHIEILPIENTKQQINILLTEDNISNQKVILSFLNKLNYNNVKVVDNGKDCVDYLQNNMNVHIVLLDIKMPIMDGEEAFKIMKNWYKQHNIIIQPYFIVLTAYYLKEDKHNYLNMGFNEYIPKPIDILKLEQTLERCVQKVIQRNQFQ